MTELLGDPSKPASLELPGVQAGNAITAFTDLDEDDEEKALLDDEPRLVHKASGFFLLAQYMGIVLSIGSAAGKQCPVLSTSIWSI